MTETMRSVSHVHRGNARNVFSEMFRRGQVTPADGGSPAPDRSRKRGTENRDGHGEEEPPEHEMRDVDHKAPDEEGASRVWDRGMDDDEE